MRDRVRVRVQGKEKSVANIQTNCNSSNGGSMKVEQEPLV